MRSLRHSPAGVRSLFFSAGALFATWGVHVPTVKTHYSVGEAALGLAMLAMGVGACLGLTQAGRLIGRFGPRPVLWVAAIVSPVIMALLLAGDRFEWVMGLLLVFGLVSSTFDVAMNVAATDLEHQAGRPVMSGFHGMFSAGGLTGAGAGALAFQVGIPAGAHLWLACVVCLLLGVWGAGTVCPGRDDEPGTRGPRRQVGRALLLLGGLAALGLLCEGAMYDWSVLYLRQELHAAPGTAAWAYASFSGAMAAGRFGGDWVRARVTAPRLLGLSALLAAVGVAAALLSPSVWLSLLGFGLVGLGLANVVPLLFVAAGQVPGVSAAQGIAVVSAMGYLGMMGGPALIGMVAQLHGLQVALAQILVFALILAGASRRALAPLRG